MGIFVKILTAKILVSLQKEGIFFLILLILNFMYQNKPLNAELNPICHLQALLAHHILHVFGISVKLRLFSKSQKNELKYK